MRVTVRLFARLRDIAGAAELAREVAPGATIGDVWRQLAPSFRSWPATSGRFRARSTPTTRGWITWSATATRSRFCRRCRGDDDVVAASQTVARQLLTAQLSYNCTATALMFDKLASEEQRYEELMHRLGTAEVQSDPSEYRKHAKALAEIEPLVERFREYKTVAARHRADRGARRRRRRRHARARARGAEVARRAPRRAPGRAQGPAGSQGSERREERHPRDPRRHRRRRSGALRRRAVPHVHASTPSARAGASR